MREIEVRPGSGKVKAGRRVRNIVSIRVVKIRTRRKQRFRDRITARGRTTTITKTRVIDHLAVLDPSSTGPCPGIIPLDTPFVPGRSPRAEEGGSTGWSGSSHTLDRPPRPWS